MFNWGLMGSGIISSQFFKAVSDTKDMKVYAIASVSGKNPYNLQAEKYYNNYEALAEDPDVDAVYVGTIHPQHLPCVKICLEAGKSVLCEKPIALNSRQLNEMIELAGEKKLFFMEAMWTRYLPATRYIKEIIQDERYGKVHYIDLTFGYRGDGSIKRLYEAALGGGALLDLGVYGVNTADFWLQEEPCQIKAWAEKTEETVDLTTSVQFAYKSGAVVNMMFSLNRNLPNKAYIITDKAEFEIPYFWRPDTVLQYIPNGNFNLDRLECKKEFPIESNGYNYEAVEAVRCINNGLLESSDMTWDTSARIMKQMDEIRRQCGIEYPQDAL